MALGNGSIDPLAFTAVRIVSGAAILLVLTWIRVRRATGTEGSWKAALILMLYAIPFAVAYVRLETGTGALLLFAAVQLTMIGSGFRAGERLSPYEWLGFAGASAGLVYLVSPGLAAPDPLAAVLMISAGVFWGEYSFTGKTARNPADATVGNFARAAILVLPFALPALPWFSYSSRGVLLTAASGAVASGLGYTVWYAALRYLTVTRASLVQLAVPVLTAAAGVLLLGERVTFRLIVASMLILGSVLLAVTGRTKKKV